MDKLMCCLVDQELKDKHGRTSSIADWDKNPWIWWTSPVELWFYSIRCLWTFSYYRYALRSQYSSL